MSKVISTRLEENLIEELERRADIAGVNRATLIANVLKEYLETIEIKSVSTNQDLNIRIKELVNEVINSRLKELVNEIVSNQLKDLKLS
jgi:uncharacterized protein YaaR (DUF327 family)